MFSVCVAATDCGSCLGSCCGNCHAHQNLFRPRTLSARWRWAFAFCCGMQLPTASSLAPTMPSTVSVGCKATTRCFFDLCSTPGNGSSSQNKVFLHCAWLAHQPHQQLLLQQSSCLLNEAAQDLDLRLHSLTSVSRANEPSMRVTPHAVMFVAAVCLGPCCILRWSLWEVQVVEDQGRPAKAGPPPSSAPHPTPRGPPQPPAAAAAAAQTAPSPVAPTVNSSWGMNANGALTTTYVLQCSACTAHAIACKCTPMLSASSCCCPLHACLHVLVM